jgi:hypothetical protein
MDAAIRKPLQGVANIIRFNRHFYVIGLNTVIMLICLGQLMPEKYNYFLLFFAVSGALSMLITLGVSWYVYDYAGIYNLKWLDDLGIKNAGSMVNINAGFDETSALLAIKYPHTQLSVFDFYDADKHTEISIARARKAYPTYPGTVAVKTNIVPLLPGSVDVVFAIFAAHEIRDRAERVQFFRQLENALSSKGKIIILEHLRDVPNFMAYNIGFFHFHSKEEWLNTFNASGLTIQGETKLTPFLSTFVLQKNGTAA